MARWTANPYVGEFDHLDTARVRAQWARLHACDAEPPPAKPALLEAWSLFHRGEFQRAAEAGLQHGGAGLRVALKAMALQATYLEKKEKTRLELFLEIAQRAEAQAQADPADAQAWYWQGYALGRYSQGISVAKALAQGLGSRVKNALEKTIALQPRHADAHIALGAFHAEVIDKVGTLIGGMTYGAKKEVGLRLFQEGLRLHPQSAIGLVEYANGLVMLEGEGQLDEATRLYEQAAAIAPADSAERLDVELARLELHE